MIYIYNTIGCARKSTADYFLYYFCRPERLELFILPMKQFREYSESYIQTVKYMEKTVKNPNKKSKGYPIPVNELRKQSWCYSYKLDWKPLFAEEGVIKLSDIISMSGKNYG